MPPQQKQYEYLDHTADIKFLAYGKTLEEVFENAALAMFNVIIDTSKVSGETAREIFLKSPDMESLLVDWLSELLYLFEVDEIVFRKFQVKEIRGEGSEFSIASRASGQEFNSENLPFETEIKAVTYNQLKIEKIADGWKAQVVVDV